MKKDNFKQADRERERIKRNIPDLDKPENRYIPNTLVSDREKSKRRVYETIK